MSRLVKVDQELREGEQAHAVPNFIFVMVEKKENICCRSAGV